MVSSQKNPGIPNDGAKERFRISVVLMSRVSEELQLLKEDDYAARLSLYEKLGDLASHIENYKQALKCYHNMVS